MSFVFTNIVKFVKFKRPCSSLFHKEFSVDSKNTLIQSTKTSISCSNDSMQLQEQYFCFLAMTNIRKGSQQVKVEAFDIKGVQFTSLCVR